MQDVVVLYFGANDTKDYNLTYHIIAKRYDQAFFMGAEQGSELEALYNVDSSQYPKALLFSKNSDYPYLTFTKDWNPRNLERWIVQRSTPEVFEYDSSYTSHIFAH